VRVHIDYHVSIDGHYYSVPHQLVRHELDARITSSTIEILHTKSVAQTNRASPLVVLDDPVLPAHLPSLSGLFQR
jgi:hypothetical protein